jgi:hypothetical protein
VTVNPKTPSLNKAFSPTFDCGRRYLDADLHGHQPGGKQSGAGGELHRQPAVGLKIAATPNVQKKPAPVAR